MHKVTGKWLFPQAELDSWLSSYPVRPKGAAPPHAMPIVGGSHDPLAVHRQAATAARFPAWSIARRTRKFCRSQIQDLDLM